MSSAIKNIRFSEYRIYFVALAILVLGATMPADMMSGNFFDISNIKSIFDSQACLIIAAIGFTVVMITGELDLSIGSVMTLGMVSFTYHANHHGLLMALVLTCVYGALVGLFNGLIVAKLKVDSFIATLASMIIVEKLNLIVTGSTPDSLDSKFEGVLESLGNGLFGMERIYFSNLVTIVLVIVIAAAIFLSRTRPGRNIYLLGANEKTAWYSGVSADNYKIAAFISGGLTAALGGAVYVLTTNAVNFDEGPGNLMTIIAAVIVGGTSMAGGKGSVFQSFIALFSLAALIKLFNLLGAKSEIIDITNGAVLGSVILYDAYVTYRQKRLKGQRHELMEELKDPAVLEKILNNPNNNEEEGDEEMQKNNNLTIICITAIACTAIVAMVLTMNKTIIVQLPDNYNVSHNNGTDNSNTSVSIDPYTLKSKDNQPLLPRLITEKVVPQVEENYKSLAETSVNRWHDEEFGLHKIKALDSLPKSPGNGPRGKNVVLLRFVDHPYLTALENGALKAAKAYGIKLKVLSAKYKHSIQAQQVAQVISERPDLVIIQPVNAKSSVKLLKDLYKAKIPVIVANQRTTPEGLKYALCWSGPDDWGNARKLSKIFVDKMDNKGEYALIRHFEGNTCFESRTWGFVTEIHKLAPGIKCVAKEATKLNREKTRLAVAGWLKQYPNLKGIISGDDGDTITGIKEACKAAGRNDIIIVASGHSKVGLDNVKSGFVEAINFQSAETDGALPIKLAADWFSGKKLNFINYLPKKIINKENVDSFYPAQW